MADFASMLKYLREREKLSQRELATKLNMSASAIGMYESGKRHPNYEDEETIADFFNVDLNTLRGKRINEDTSENAERERVIREIYKNFPDELLDDPDTATQIVELVSLALKTNSDVRAGLVKTLKGLIS